MVHFQGTDYRAHTSCMSEAQKYQGHLYRGEKKGKGPQNKKQEQALVPHNAPEPTTTTVAKVEAPPKAPSPPPSGTDLPPGVNVFDYMDTPAKIESAPFVTPASKRDREDKNKSDKKRKRIGDQDMADATPALHSGLTGGLDRMLSGPEFGNGDAAAASPLSPKKRSKKDESERDAARKVTFDKSASKKSSSADARESKQLVTYTSPAELFLSFVNKGPDSDRGLSINKALKRYHRERQSRGEDDSDKDLWKDLRIRKNERGEFVLFI